MKTAFVLSSIALAEGVRHCIRVATIRDALTQKIRELHGSGQLLKTTNFRGKIWIAIGGDKGGTSTKLMALIINSAFASLVQNLIVIGMYKGSDDAENLRIAFESFAPELEALTSLPVPWTSAEDSPVDEVPIELFLVGNTSFLGAVLGHQGSTSLFLCPFCVIPQSALKAAGCYDCQASHIS